jgi:octanoyl-[GcvH]:protein N-octanoyltransferase
MKNMQSEFDLLRDGFPGDPAMGPALSRVLLDQVATGKRGPTVRLSRTGRVVAFGRRDTTSPGYREAVASARAGGFEAMERIAGGRAAAYSEGTLSLTMTFADPTPAKRTNQRFEFAASVARDALAGLGVDARVGEVEGEYCPGAFSVNSKGRTKLVGIGQRMIRGAAHVGFVITVRDAAAIRRVLEPVYASLGLQWNPSTVGAVEDELEGADLPAVEEALLGRISADSRLVETELDAETAAAAHSRAERFLSPG